MKKLKTITNLIFRITFCIIVIYLSICFVFWNIFTFDDLNKAHPFYRAVILFLFQFTIIFNIIFIINKKQNEK